MNLIAVDVGTTETANVQGPEFCAVNPEQLVRSFIVNTSRPMKEITNAAGVEIT